MDTDSSRSADDNTLYSSCTTLWQIQHNLEVLGKWAKKEEEREHSPERVLIESGIQITLREFNKVAGAIEELNDGMSRILSEGE